jgi:hypothetical protein
LPVIRSADLSVLTGTVARIGRSALPSYRKQQFAQRAGGHCQHDVVERHAEVLGGLLDFRKR